MPSPGRKAARSMPQSRRPSSRPATPPSSTPYRVVISCARIRSSHHLEERRLELVHILLCAHRHPPIRRHARPHPADVDLFLHHGFDNLFSRPPHVHHELIRYRGDVLESFLVEERQYVLAPVPDDLPPLRPQRLRFQPPRPPTHPLTPHAPP